MVVTDHLGIGIDLGGSKTIIVIMDDLGKIHYKKRLESSSDWTVLETLTKEAVNNISSEKGQISALGIGIAGMTDCRNGIVKDAPALQWKNFDLLGTHR